MSLSVRLTHGLGAFLLDAAFDAPDGVTALHGPSGAGKTTLVNAVAGLLRPDAGRIAVGGTVLLDRQRGIDLPAHRRGVGYVFQDARLFPHLSVRQNLLFGRWFAARTNRGGGPDLPAIAELLGIGGLLHRRPAALSGGEAQRVALGRALLARPRLLLLDEPLAALDDARKAEILPYLERLRDIEGLPILYVSHSAPEIRRMATTVIRLERGRVTRQGTPAQMLPDPAAAPGVEWEVTLRDSRDGIAVLESPAGPLRIAGPVGQGPLRLRIRADQVLIARQPPQGLMVRNILEARVIGPLPEDAGLLRLQAGDGMLLARLPDPGDAPPAGSLAHAILTGEPEIVG